MFKSLMIAFCCLVLALPVSASTFEDKEQMPGYVAPKVSAMVPAGSRFIINADNSLTLLPAPELVKEGQQSWHGTAAPPAQIAMVPKKTPFSVKHPKLHYFGRKTRKFCQSALPIAQFCGAVGSCITPFVIH